MIIQMTGPVRISRGCNPNMFYLHQDRNNVENKITLTAGEFKLIETAIRLRKQGKIFNHTSEIISGRLVTEVILTMNDVIGKFTSFDVKNSILTEDTIITSINNFLALDRKNPAPHFSNITWNN